MTARRGWCLAAGGWSVVFAAPHFYWAVGGRAGLGSQAAVADAALEQPWFATYNVAAGGLGVLGAVLALTLLQRWGTGRLRRWGLAAAALASALLVVRGLLGLTVLVMGFDGDVFNGSVPAILVAVEPWFVIGGVAFGLMVREQYADELRP